MDIAQLKEKIRNLSRADRLEMYTWIDEEASAEFLCKWREVEQRRNAITTLIKEAEYPYR